MAVYTISDLHLSLSGDHSMDVFPGWQGYVERIEQNWREHITDADTVVLPGDTSWGLSLEESLADFAFIDRLPGKKILLKGNHDYWWTTKNKMERFFSEHGLNSLQILHNNSVVVEGMAICGSRGWLFETGEAFDAKIINREAIRLELSLAEAEKQGSRRLYSCTIRQSMEKMSPRRFWMCFAGTGFPAAITAISMPRAAAMQSKGGIWASISGW